MTTRTVAEAVATIGTGRYLRLSLMIFIESAILSAVIPILPIYMQHVLKLTAWEMSVVYAVGPIAAILVPLALGQVADRYLPANRLLILVNMLRTGALIYAARASSFGEFLSAMALVAACQAPSATLGAAVVFHHLPDSTRFGGLRVWGTLSWILVVWAASFYLDGFAEAAQAAHTRDCFSFAAALAAIHTLYALTLPATPPSRERRNPAIVSTVALLANRRFLAIALGALITGAALPFYMVLASLFYVDTHDGLGVSVATASRASTVAQSLELLLFPALGGLMARFGVRRVLFWGLAAWPVRFAALMMGGPAWLVIGTQALHGINVVFWMAAAVVAVDLISSSDIRASAQGLYAATFSGVGALSGQLLVGQILGFFTDSSGRHDWWSIFCVPLSFTAVGACSFLALFREPRSASSSPTQLD